MNRALLGKWSLSVAIAIFPCIALWALATGLKGEPFTPGPLMVVAALRDLLSSADFWSSLAATGGRIVVGSTVALLAGTAIALLVHFKPTVGRPLQLLAAFGLAVPALVWAMISVTLQGASEGAAALAIVGVVTPFVATSMQASIAEVSPIFFQVAKAFTVPLERTLRWYVLPSVIRSMISAYKTALALSWKVVVIVETFGFGDGVGQELANAFAFYDLSRIIAITIIFMVLIAFVHFLLDRLASDGSEAGIA